MVRVLSIALYALTASAVAACVAGTILTAVPVPGPVPSVQAAPQEPIVRVTEPEAPPITIATPEPIPEPEPMPDEEPQDGDEPWAWPDSSCESPGLWVEPEDVRVRPVWVGNVPPNETAAEVLNLLAGTYYPTRWTWTMLPWLTVESLEEAHRIAANEPDRERGGWAMGDIYLIITTRDIRDPEDNRTDYDGWACHNTATLEQNAPCWDGLVAHEVGHLLGLQHRDGGFMEDVCNEVALTSQHDARIRHRAWALS